MSGFDNGTNRGRIERIGETLDLLIASAKSNKAPDDELHRLLIPVLAKLGDLGIVAGPGHMEPPASFTTRAALPPEARAAVEASFGVTAEEAIESLRDNVGAMVDAGVSLPFTAKRRALALASYKTDKAVKAVERVLAELRELQKAAVDPL